MSLAVLKYMETVMAVYFSYWGTGHWALDNGHIVRKVE